MSKIAVCADIHLHPFSQFSTTVDGVNSRQAWTRSALDCVVKRAVDHEADGICVLGDVFHSRGKVDTASLVIFKRWLDVCVANGLFVTLIAGNHDQSDVQANFNVLSVYHNPASRIFVISEPHIHDCDGWDIDKRCLLLPYHENHAVQQQCIADAGELDYIFGHAAIRGAALTQTDYRVDEGLEPSKITVPSYWGHYHQRQSVTSNVHYIGNLLPQTFHDEGQAKGFDILDLDTNERTFIPTMTPQFRTITVQTESDLPDPKDYPIDYIKIVAHCPVSAAYRAQFEERLVVMSPEAASVTSAPTAVTGTALGNYVKNEVVDNKTALYRKVKGYVDSQ